MRVVERLSRVACLAMALAIPPLFGACSDGPLSAPSDPRYSEEDVFWDESTGFRGYSDVNQGADVAGTFPEWNGSDPRVAGLQPGAIWSCPNAAYSVMVITTSNRGTFVIAGWFLKEHEFGVLRNGRPTARYSIPAGQWNNTEGNYYIAGGVVDVECWGFYVNLGITKRWVGTLEAYAYYGSSGPASSRGPSGGGGWAYSSTGTRNGSTGGGSGNPTWESVLDHYLATGECTPGWVIVIDSRVVC